MNIIVGGTGHVGGAVSRALLDAGEKVTIVTRDAATAAGWGDRGALLAEVNVRDIEGLRRVFKSGSRAFLLNPPADPSADTDAVERQSVADLLAAVTGSGLELIVAQSTYGARPGAPCGDLNVLYELEQGLSAQPIPCRIIRAAYHYANWCAGIETAKDHGFIESVLPVDLVFPMAAPEDIGAECAKLMRGDVGSSLAFVEGPERYSPRHVADVFAQRLGRPVEVRVVAGPDLNGWFQKAGFSQAAAESYACMARATTQGVWPALGEVIRGSTTLADYFSTI
ncbi:NmrA family transcriptional regulator [Massilia violaceinigra]|uniref:NmrA family transcriptional regulator n=1 Tax=Massilia violaceinigra TaxID=2045208 RepID=A0A2D2DNY1_9BURK|nr:NmrA family NAD(P)-binding protein [Massilia violaceinigra]ATQ76681.1 NmrA family transcriptional regulator [Massilia violaceinigra]